jgi:hypothetical protein
MTNIDHSKCDHPRTSGARAKCRRGGSQGTAEVKASTKEVDFKGSGGSKPKTPRDRENQCMVCGVERFEYRGRDPLTGTMLYVGEKCYYMVQNDPDAQGWDPKEKEWFPANVKV